MIRRRGAACWLLLASLAAGCASAPSEPAAGDASAAPGRPRLEITREPAPKPGAPGLPPALSPLPAPTPAPPIAGATPPPPQARPAPSPPAGPTEPPGTAPQTGPPGRQLVLNFDNADVEVVIQAAADIVGFNYVLAPAVRGRKITVQTVGKISSDEVFAVLLTILDVNGLAAVRSGNLYRIIPREAAAQTPVKTVVGREVEATLPPDEVVTQVIPLRLIDAQDAVKLLRPFVPAQGAMAAHRETNVLILTDTAANVRRLLAVLERVDVEMAGNEPQIIPLKHADAQELGQILAQLFAGGRLGGSGLPAPAAAPTGAGGPAADRPLIVPERRSNSLVVHARTQDIETIRRLVARLDVDIHGGQRVFIHFAENARARDLATTLDAIYGRGDRGAAITGAQQTPPGSTSISGRSGSHRRIPSPPLSPPTPLPPPPTLVTTGPQGTGSPSAFPTASGEGAPPGVEIRFVADEATNAIIVTTSPRLWKEIAETIRKLDKMPRQVLIEVLAAEVTLTDDTKLGIEWAVRSGRFDVGSSPSGLIPGRPARSIIPLGGAVPLGFNVFTFAADKLLAALNALASENRVNVLSNPSIMTAENRKAVINVSTSVPIVTAQQVPVATGGITGNAITQTVEYRDAGIILTVTPRIGEQGTVALDVKQEVNEVGENEPPPINSPRFTKREAETSVVLLNNQTLVLGGLIQNKRTRIRTGLPWLDRIPILGYLFGSVQTTVEKTELVLLITPRTIGTALDAARISEEMRRVTPELERAIQRAPRPPPASR